MTRPPSGTDAAELLTRLRASGLDAGLDLFDRFADRVYDLVLFLTRDAVTAAETTRDVIVLSANQRGGFCDADALKAWLYAQARTEAFALLNARGRIPSEDRVVELPDLPADPTAADLAGVVWSATAAFSERDQALLALHLRHGLEGQVLADAMGVSVGAVEILLPATLDRVQSQTGLLLWLALGCDLGPALPDELLALREEWDGTFSPLVRRRAQLLEHDAHQWSARAEMSPLQLLQSTPLVPAPASLRDAVAERLAMTRSLVAGDLAGDAPDDGDHTLPPDDSAALPVLAPVTAPNVTGGAVTGGASDTGEVPEPVPEAVPEVVASRRQRMPSWLAVALGVAVGLVVAAGLFRVVVLGGATPTPSGSAFALTVDPDAAQATAAPAVPSPLTGATSSVPAAAAIDPTAAAGSLTVPADAVHIPAVGGAPLRLTNPGGTAVEWQVLSAPAWMTLDRSQGSVDPGATVEIAAAMVAQLPEGDYVGDVVVQWDGPSSDIVSIAASGVSERSPDLQQIQIGSQQLFAEGCGVDQTEVAVIVTDESPVIEVLVTTTGPGEQVMQVMLRSDPQQPERFIGVVGPFVSGGQVGLGISASDARGNRAEADSAGLTVTGCQ
ncbi:MAG: hypothetical protein ACR2HR_17620 [Euzebya sp.]